MADQISAPKGVVNKGVVKLASLDIHYLVDELKQLERGKVVKIFQDVEDKRHFLFDLHSHALKKTYFRVHLPEYCYLTQNKPSMSDSPPPYAMFLRKYLKNSRIQKVWQKDFERIIVFDLSTKDADYHLVIELFSKGNLILCEEDWKIKSPLENQNWADRTIRGGIKYQFPPLQANSLAMSKDEFIEKLKSSKKDSLVTALAIDLSLSGRWAEELCALAGIRKDLQKPSLKDFEGLFSAFQKLKNQSVQPGLQDNVPVPFRFHTLQSKFTSCRSFNDALDSVIPVNIEVEDKNLKARKEAMSRKEKILRSQEEKIKGFDRSSQDSRRKGELLFEHYNEVDEVLKTIDVMRRKKSWKEIKEHFEGHPIVKVIDEKKGEVVVELE
ncbi:NFACT family protein [Candidatus Woesearchaeota archaeon]|nr:NFACT family protein [Candidatus Woesearchaeota archaeon]